MKVAKLTTYLNIPEEIAQAPLSRRLNPESYYVLIDALARVQRPTAPLEIVIGMEDIPHEEGFIRTGAARSRLRRRARAISEALEGLAILLPKGATLLFNTVHFANDEIRLAVASEIVEVIRSPKRYGPVDLYFLSRIDHAPSMRLYSLLAPIFNRAFRKVTLDLGTVRKTLSQAGGYDRYNHFKAKILGPAITRLNSLFEDKFIVIEEIASGKGGRVSAIKFVLEDKEVVLLQPKMSPSTSSDTKTWDKEAEFMQLQKRQAERGLVLPFISPETMVKALNELGGDTDELLRIIRTGYREVGPELHNRNDDRWLLAHVSLRPRSRPESDVMSDAEVDEMLAKMLRGETI